MSTSPWRKRRTQQGRFAHRPYVRTALLSSYLAVHLREERIAILVALLVIPHQPKLFDGEVAQVFGGLLDVHVVVAGDGEDGRLRSRARRVHGGPRRGAGCPGHGTYQAGGRLGEGARALANVSDGLIGAFAVAGDGVIQELG